MSRILVIGGGPAGSAFAIEAASQGLDVVVLERDVPGRDKVCGDALIPDAQHALQKLGVLDYVTQKGIQVGPATISTYHGAKFDVEVPIIVLQRRELDQLLRDRVVQAGGKVHYGAMIDSVHTDPTGVVANDRNGNAYYADALILATGATTVLATQLGFKSPPATVMAARGYVRNVTGLNSSWLWMTERLAPAYAWAFPCPGNIVNVGLGYYRNGRPAKSLSTLLDQFLHEDARSVLGVTEFIAQPKAWPLRTGLKREGLVADRVLLVGENAHSTYDLTGEGIGKALESGMLAAKAIVEADGDYSAVALGAYPRLLEQHTRRFYAGYARATTIMSNPVSNYLFIKLLEHSQRAQKAFSSIICEELSASQLFSVRGFVRHIF